MPCRHIIIWGAQSGLCSINQEATFCSSNKQCSNIWLKTQRSLLVQIHCELLGSPLILIGWGFSCHLENWEVFYWKKGKNVTNHALTHNPSTQPQVLTTQRLNQVTWLALTLPEQEVPFYQCLEGERAGRCLTSHAHFHLTSFTVLGPSLSSMAFSTMLATSREPDHSPFQMVTMPALNFLCLYSRLL